MSIVRGYEAVSLLVQRNLWGDADTGFVPRLFGVHHLGAGPVAGRQQRAKHAME